MFLTIQELQPSGEKAHGNALPSFAPGTIFAHLESRKIYLKLFISTRILPARGRNFTVNFLLHTMMSFELVHHFWFLNLLQLPAFLLFACFLHGVFSTGD